MSNATIPAAMGTAVEVPSLRSVWISSSPLTYKALAPSTATPKALYFSTPDLYEVNSLRFPFPSAAPMHKTIGRLAGKVMGSLAPSFEAEARMIIPSL